MLLPAAIVLIAGMVLALEDGGYAKTTWYPVALFLLAMLGLVLVVAPPGRRELSRPFAVAATLFGLFTAWNFLSLLWAGSPGDAWEGANRALLYYTAFLLVGMRPWPWRSGRLALGLLIAAVAGVALWLLNQTAGDEPTRLFLGARLSEPLGYANATANFWMIAFWPALHFAIDRWTPWWARAGAMGVAALLLHVSLLSQSRGALAGFAITGAVFLLLHPRHWAGLAALGVQIGLLAVAWDPLTAVRNATDAASVEQTLSDARGAIAVAVAAGVVAGLAGALADRLAAARDGASPRRARLAARSFYALAGAVAVALALVAAGSGGWLGDRWDEFRTTSYASFEANSPNRFASGLESGRYDVWRVAWHEFAERPVTGLGAENYAVEYLQERRTGEAPRYPHSLLFSLLSMLGIVGTLLFAGAVAAALAGFAAVRRRAHPAAQATAVGAAVGFVAWLSHAMVDWLWEYPALTLPALALLAIACRTTGDPEPAAAGPPQLPGEPEERGLGAPVRLLAGVALVLAAMSLALATAAARFERSGYAVQRTDPALAVDRLGRAADLDPLSADALIARAVLLRNGGDRRAALADLDEAVEREPDHWFAQLELGMLQAVAGEWPAAEAAVERSHALNPRQPVVTDVLRRVRSRRAVDPAAVERAFDEQLSVRFRPFGSE